MSIALRSYQQDIKGQVYESWNNNHQNVMVVSPTGSGKTVIFSDVLLDHQNNTGGAACAIAHRQELVGQISLALARDEVRHQIHAPKSVIKFIIAEQHRELGKSFYQPNAPIAVAGVDTIIRREEVLRPWLNRVTKWIMDEAHHVLVNNKWGRAIQLMPNAVGLGVTATPCRADGNGLGRCHDGLFDKLIVGPSMRDLINQGYLTDYRIFAPPSDLDVSKVETGVDGDYKREQLKNAVKDSHLVGDVVDHYMRIAHGKLGITFATDVDSATIIAQQFNLRGVPAAVLTAKSPPNVRAEVIRQFKNRQLLQLVNVDLFGEGFDLPAVEVVSMARPTQSYALFVQQFGRALRILEGKDVAIIIDHVSNVMRHGLPDAPRDWSLMRREKKPRALKSDDDIPIRYCVECTQPYERIYKKCPYCGTVHIPAGRSLPEYVDGDLLELDPEVLRAMRKEVERIDMPVEALRKGMTEGNYSEIVKLSACKNHKIRQEVQAALRTSIGWWCGIKKNQGYDDSQLFRLFYLMFGVDVLTAQGLGKGEALKLADKINNSIGEMMI